KDELALTSVPFSPDASAVVLDWRIDQDDVKRYVTEYVRMKVLNETGRKYASIELPYDEKYTSIRDLRGRTIEPDGTVVPFDGKAFQKTIVKGRGVSITAKSFTLPDVRAGSIFEYAYTHTWLSDTYVPPTWFVQREIPILHEHHTFRGLWLPNYVTINLGPGTEPKKTGERSYEFEFRNMPASEDEPFALPAEAHQALLAFFYQSPSRTVAEYWANAAGDYATGFAGFIGDSRFIRDAVPGIVGDAKTDEEKLRKIYARVQQIENLSDSHKSEEQLKREGKNRKIESAEELLRNGYGGTMGMELIFVALARAAGIDADPVLLANHTKPFSKELPVFAQLSSLAVIATIDGKDFYFDPGYSMLPFAKLHYENSGVDGMRLRKKGGPVWVRTPIPPPTDAVMRRTASLHLNGDDVAGTLHVELGGYEAFRRRLDEQRGDDASHRKSLEDEVKSWLPAGATAKLTAMSSWKSVEPLTADFDVTIPSVISTGGSHTLMPLALLNVGMKNPFTAEKRRYDVHFNYAHSVEDTITIKLPAGVTVSKLPEPSNIADGPLSFHATPRSDATSITLDRAYTIGVPRIPVAAYPRLRSFIASVASADALPAVLEKSK
ncbi:MAG TPA: DUF3857 domain-containing protein, partial [Thermoanaerobaculia bacterium]|nr:DUF3857 domain-containing protein [Thermoanaerobaculia bacterium]